MSAVFPSQGSEQHTDNISQRSSVDEYCGSSSSNGNFSIQSSNCEQDAALASTMQQSALSVSVSPVVGEQQQQQQQQQEEQALVPVENEENSRSLPAANNECPHHGLVSFIGRRKEMEDAAAAVPDFFSLPCDITRHSIANDHTSSFHFFAVYDGHGGSQAANFCKNRFHVALVEEMKASITAGGFASSNEVTNWDSLWERAMQSCFLKVDAEIGGLCIQPGGRCDKCEGNGLCTEPIAPDTVGSTAVVAVVGCCRIIVANCGDSRVVISRGGRAIPLSNDHKPERDDEMERIEEAGGRVIFWNGYRVMGMLAMSRAIGDRYLKPYVIPTPDVRCLRRTEEDEFLVLASDGLWDVLNNEQVCDVTRMCLAGRCNSNVVDGVLSSHLRGTENSQARVAAAYLTKLAYNRKSSDNISVLVVDFTNGQAAVATATAIAGATATAIAGAGAAAAAAPPPPAAETGLLSTS